MAETSAASPLTASPLTQRSRRLGYIGDGFLLAALLAMTAAIALWAVDPTSVHAFNDKIDVPPSLLPTLRSAGLRLFEQDVADLSSAWPPIRAEVALACALLLVSVGAALRLRWPLYFACQGLLLVASLVASRFGFELSLQWTVLPAIVAGLRVLIARQGRMILVLVTLAGVAVGLGSLVPLSSATYGAEGHRSLRIREIERLANVPGATRMNDIVAGLPVGSDRNYFEAQLAYNKRDWPVLSARAGALPTHDYANIQTSRRLAILRQTADFLAGGRRFDLLQRLPGYGLALLTFALALAAFVVGHLARTIGRREGRLNKLSAQLRVLRAAGGVTV